MKCKVIRTQYSAKKDWIIFMGFERRKVTTIIIAWVGEFFLNIPPKVDSGELIKTKEGYNFVKRNKRGHKITYERIDRFDEEIKKRWFTGIFKNLD